MHFSPLCLGWGVSVGDRVSVRERERESERESERAREEGVFIKENGVELHSITHAHIY